MAVGFKRVLYFLILITGIAALLQYQNCSDARLSSVYKLSSVGNLTGQFCAQSVKGFYVTNLTLKMVADQLQADSDMDGLTDNFEDASTSPRFDSNKRRTFGILDSICLSRGGISCNTFADATPLSLGITAGDMNGFSALSGGLGLDSDDDGIPDFVEILKSSDLIRDDAFADVDSDGVNNMTEIQLGTDLNSAQDALTPVNYKTKASYWPVSTGANPCVGGQKLYQFNVDSIPLGPVKAYSPEISEEAALSHAANENVVLISYVSWPTDGVSKKGVYFKIVKLDILKPSAARIPIAPQEFSLQGQGY